MKQVRILQIKDDTMEGVARMFAPLSRLERMGLEFDPKYYTEVYNGQMNVTNAEQVFVLLQMPNKPKGYKGHSLSVSDLVQMDGKTLFSCFSHLLCLPLCIKIRKGKGKTLKYGLRHMHQYVSLQKLTPVLKVLISLRFRNIIPTFVVLNLSC